MPRKGDILGYARVSTVEQDVAAQHDRLKAAGAIRVFEDVVSGKTFNRPGLSALIDYAWPDDSLCVIRLDRLGRSLKELLETVDDLKKRDINLISLEEKIDTTSAAGELVFHVFGAIAHFEQRLISERSNRGKGCGAGCYAGLTSSGSGWIVGAPGTPRRSPRYSKNEMPSF